MTITIKRAYEAPCRQDGYRVLVDRVWPRGVRKEDLALDDWCNALAPGTELRKWFGHDPDKWQEFRERYFRELDGQAEMIQALRARAAKGRVTLVYGAKESRYNNAVALKEYLERIPD